MQTASSFPEIAILAALVLGSLLLVVAALWTASRLRLDQAVKARLPVLHTAYQPAPLALVAVVLIVMTGGVPGPAFLLNGVGAICACMFFAGVCGISLTTRSREASKQQAQNLRVESRQAA